MNIQVPKHVAFIMDGNGRWAKARGKSRSFGHVKGAEVLDALCDRARDLGIHTLSFYAFSTENWKRPKEEVSRLLALLSRLLKTKLPYLIKNQTRLLVSGDLSVLDKKRRDNIENAMKKTAHFTERTVNICFNYGSRSEILRAVNSLVEKGEFVDEKAFEQELYTKDLSDVDLVIRTSGEKRLSNFLLWQSAYAEIYFTDVLWPDFTPERFDEALEWYYKRNRRFGGV